MNYLVKGYRIPYIRIPFKFMISLAIMKMFGDLFYFLVQGQKVTFPRCVI